MYEKQNEIRIFLAEDEAKKIICLGFV